MSRRGGGAGRRGAGRAADPEIITAFGLILAGSVLATRAPASGLAVPATPAPAGGPGTPARAPAAR